MVDWNADVLDPCMAAFGEPCTYRDAWGVDTQITAVFDEAYLELTPMGRGPGLDAEAMAYGLAGAVSTAMPALGIQVSQLSREPRQNDAVLIRGNWYRVKEYRPDGKGGAKLLLNGAF